jgi:hypothetical protein
MINRPGCELIDELVRLVGPEGACRKWNDRCEFLKGSSVAELRQLLSA